MRKAVELCLQVKHSRKKYTNVILLKQKKIAKYFCRNRLLTHAARNDDYSELKLSALGKKQKINQKLNFAREQLKKLPHLIVTCMLAYKRRAGQAPSAN